MATPPAPKPRALAVDDEENISYLLRSRLLIQGRAPERMPVDLSALLEDAAANGPAAAPARQVEAHGGRVAVVRSPGHGTTFRVAIPTTPPPTPPHKASEPEHSLSARI